MKKLTPRQLGTNPRAMGTSPRQLGDYRTPGILKQPSNRKNAFYAKRRRDLRATTPKSEYKVMEILQAVKPKGNNWSTKSLVGRLWMQYPIMGFYADFMLKINNKQRVVIEIDEAHHFLELQNRYDRKRDELFSSCGYYVCRIPASAVFEEADKIKKFFQGVRNLDFSVEPKWLSVEPNESPSVLFLRRVKPPNPRP